jgi:hypothetical protein
MIYTIGNLLFLGLSMAQNALIQGGYVKMRVWITRKDSQKSPTLYEDVTDLSYWTDSEKFVRITTDKGFVAIPVEDIYKIQLEN